MIKSSMVDIILLAAMHGDESTRRRARSPAGTPSPVLCSSPRPSAPVLLSLCSLVNPACGRTTRSLTHSFSLLLLTHAYMLLGGTQPQLEKIMGIEYPYFFWSDGE
jgi:hypothetical protein